MGLCIVCCKGKPNLQRLTCAKCKAATVIRNRRRRHEKREEVSGTVKLLAAHERAGDIAREHHFHAAAAQHYQDGLTITTITPNDYDRVSEKLIQALFLSGDPDAVNPWHECLLASYLAEPGNSIKAFDILTRIARQLWLDSKAKGALPIITQALQLAKTLGDRSLWIRSNLQMSNFLHILGRFEEAQPFLKAVSDINERDAVALRIFYYRLRAEESGALGNRAESYRYFEQALSIAKGYDDPYRVAITWYDYSHYALILGDTSVAKSCAEHALLISRQNRLAWHIPFICLIYADILARIGQYGTAHGYLIEALSYDAKAPLLEKTLAEVGIPLALRMKDEATLVKCAHPAAITLAFQSGESTSIGPVAAAFSQLYQAQGNTREAQALLHRAVETVLPADFGWDLPLEIARQGAAADISRARSLLEARTMLPSSNVAQACLSLFDARVADRESKLSTAHMYARNAMKRFEALGWYSYADEARSLLPRGEQILQANRVQSSPLMDIRSLLTMREQQVVGLVLRGLTNRAIAAELSIAENTVEKHMTSIMNRLGIRSRHQLAETAVRS